MNTKALLCSTLRIQADAAFHSLPDLRERDLRWMNSSLVDVHVAISGIQEAKRLLTPLCCNLMLWQTTSQQACPKNCLLGISIASQVTRRERWPALEGWTDGRLAIMRSCRVQCDTEQRQEAHWRTSKDLLVSGRIEVILIYLLVCGEKFKMFKTLKLCSAYNNTHTFSDYICQNVKDTTEHIESKWNKRPNEPWCLTFHICQKRLLCKNQAKTDFV